MLPRGEKKTIIIKLNIENVFRLLGKTDRLFTFYVRIRE